MGGHPENEVEDDVEAECETERITMRSVSTAPSGLEK